MKKRKTRAEINLNVSFEDIPLTKKNFNNIEDTIANLKELKKKLGGK